MCGARARILSFATSSSSSSPCFQPNIHHKVIALALTRTAHHHTQLGTPFHIKIIHFHLKCPIEIYSKIHCRYAHGTLFAFKCVYMCVCWKTHPYTMRIKILYSCLDSLEANNVSPFVSFFFPSYTLHRLCTVLMRGTFLNIEGHAPIHHNTI